MIQSLLPQTQSWLPLSVSPSGILKGMEYLLNECSPQPVLRWELQKGESEREYNNCLVTPKGFISQFHSPNMLFGFLSGFLVSELYLCVGLTWGCCEGLVLAQSIYFGI